MDDENKAFTHKRNGIEKIKIFSVIIVMLFSFHFCLLLSRPESYKWFRFLKDSTIITKDSLNKQNKPLIVSCQSSNITDKHDFKQYAFCIVGLVSAIYLFRTLNDD
ncbi:MAG: hypothetical protein PHV17_10345 [Candidatus Omnitrophica bacterium]|nr:hypothetical protein [Candidatus Omnitrophota bacterium]